MQKREDQGSCLSSCSLRLIDRNALVALIIP